MDSFRAISQHKGEANPTRIRRMEASALDWRHAIVLKPSLQILLAGKKASCSRFSYDENWLAIGNDCGEIEVHRVADGGHAFTLKPNGRQRWPCTALCFRPSTTTFSTRNVIVSCDVGGQIHHWHALSGKHLGTIQEADNQLYAIDIQETGLKYATAGVDTKVRIYDEVTRKLLHTLNDGNGKTSAGHTNRVFSVHWHPTDENVVVSGGWDNTVQEWDYGSARLICNLDWRDNHPCRVYSAKYGRFPSQRVIGAGGSGSNEACLLDLDTHQVLALLSELEKAVCSVSFSPFGNLLAVTTTNIVFVIELMDMLLTYK
ncbi:hypothetical protein O6H91_13G050600 [Diphasiastrum complanatum]|uniref:Uncharacterized protein n=1 Tax=Diphasiastrum complanatum TaxID=34168 RepID=A0ACC2BUN3_DIPCM|nr:hypothetical protein O6H91_13G050600 [Diphasiastrum complanatum]